MNIKYRNSDGAITEVDGQLFSGVVDMHGQEIVAGDTLRFTDKWEWYRVTFGGIATRADYNEVLNNHEKYPYEVRVVELPRDYEWLLGTQDIQTYWEIVK